MEKITSRENPKIKETAKLLSNSRERKKAEQFVVEGLRLCTDAVKSGVEIESAFMTGDFVSKHKNEADMICSSSKKQYEISDDISKKLSDTENGQGVFLVCGYPEEKEMSGKKIAVLDGVSDPSNVGAVARSAEAFGIKDLVLLSSCADAFSPKSLRASMGAFFRLNVVSGDIKTLQKLKDDGYKLYGSVVDGYNSTLTKTEFFEKSVMIIGSEAFGMRDETRKICDTLLTIEMKGRAESLNASAAATLLFWEMTK